MRLLIIGVSGQVTGGEKKKSKKGSYVAVDFSNSGANQFVESQERGLVERNAGACQIGLVTPAFLNLEFQSSPLNLQILFHNLFSRQSRKEHEGRESSPISHALVSEGKNDQASTALQQRIW